MYLHLPSLIFYIILFAILAASCPLTWWIYQRIFHRFPKKSAIFLTFWLLVLVNAVAGYFILSSVSKTGGGWDETFGQVLLAGYSIFALVIITLIEAITATIFLKKKFGKSARPAVIAIILFIVCILYFVLFGAGR